MSRILPLLLLLTCLCVATPLWQAHTSPEGHFRGVFPDLPAASRFQNNSVLGTVTTTILSSSNQLGDYSIACTELPPLAARLARSRVISDAKREVLNDARATEKGWESINGGHQLTYQSPQREGWSQFFLVGNRLYVLDARLAVGSDRVSLVTPFFAQFSPI